MIWYISKTTMRDYKFHSLFTLILRLLMKRYTDVNQIMINHILNHIRSIKTVDMDIRLSVVMMISIVNQSRYIEQKMLSQAHGENVRRS